MNNFNSIEVFPFCKIRVNDKKIPQEYLTSFEHTAIHKLTISTLDIIFNNSFIKEQVKNNLQLYKKDKLCLLYNNCRIDVKNIINKSTLNIIFFNNNYIGYYYVFKKNDMNIIPFYELLEEYNQDHFYDFFCSAIFQHNNILILQPKNINKLWVNLLSIPEIYKNDKGSSFNINNMITKNFLVPRNDPFSQFYTSLFKKYIFIILNVKNKHNEIPIENILFLINDQLLKECINICYANKEKINLFYSCNPITNDFIKEFKICY